MYITQIHGCKTDKQDCITGKVIWWEKCMAQKINNAFKKYHKAFGKIHFIQVFFPLSTICSIYIIFLWILSDIKEKKIKQHYYV